MNPPYRAAVIGCGLIGSTIADVMVARSPIRMGLPYGHAPVYRAVPRTELVAAADPDSERRRAFAARWDVPPERVYADYRAMLERERIEVVSIATPTPTHAAIGLAAVDAGVRAIFIEKPIASNLADADRLVAACARAGIPLAVNHTRRGDPIYRQARALIATGFIGKLHSLLAHFDGHLMVTGTHAFDMLNFLNGDEPLAWLTGQLDDAPGDDPGGSAYAVYRNGVRAFVNGSTGSAMLFRIQAVGSAGEIVIGNHELDLFRRNPERAHHELLRHPFPLMLPAVSPMVQLVEELLDALETDAPMVSTGVTGTAALEFTIAIHASSRRDGAKVTFPVADREIDVPSR